METVLNQFSQLPNALMPKLGIEELNTALGYSFVDNLNRKQTTDNWQSNFNGQTLHKKYQPSQKILSLMMDTHN